MQAPGRADEDTRDGFEHGGWSPPYGDEAMGAAMGARMAESDGLLLGRRTYEDLLAYWNTQDSPFIRRGDRHLSARQMTLRHEKRRRHRKTEAAGEVTAAGTATVNLTAPFEARPSCT